MITKSNLSKKILNDTILDSMPGLAYIYSKDGNLVAWNKRAEEILEYSTDEMYGRSVKDFVEEKSRERLIEVFQSIFTLGYAQTEIINITKSGKKIPLLATGTRVYIESEEYLIGLALDMSELYSAREKINEQLDHISRLNEFLQSENIYLKNQLASSFENYDLLGESESIKYIHFKIKQVAPSDASVLIQGETGTGKELVARAIHKESKRKDKPFIIVNCASIPENLVESELFGHEKGAYTGAVEKRLGKFELVNGGTIFLDEIGELPLNIQPKLLHVLQRGEFERIGSSKTIKTNVRIISATNKILEDQIKKGLFRSDLYYRFNVFPITIAPLRERKDDIRILAEHYIKFYSEKLNKPIKGINKEAMQRLLNYSWPGNVRELENIIERAVITSHNKILNIESFPKYNSLSEELISLEEAEKNHIIKALLKTYWKINGTDGAANILKLHPETLRSKMRKLGIKRFQLS